MKSDGKVARLEKKKLRTDIKTNIVKDSVLKKICLKKIIFCVSLLLNKEKLRDFIFQA